MKADNTPILKDLVLVGGGHSHVIVLKQLGMKPVPGVRTTLICRDVETPYSGMLPGHIAGHYTCDDIHIDLRPLTRFANVRFYHDEVVGLDPVERMVLCRTRPPIPYDVLSIDIGSTPRMNDVPGAAGVVVSVKPIGNFISHWNALVERVFATAGAVRIGVVGAGAGGVEIVLAAHHGLRARLEAAGRDPDRLSFELFAAGAEVLPRNLPRIRAAFARVLSERGIRVHVNARADRVSPGVLHTADGTVHPLDEMLWTTPAGAQAWLAESGLATDEHGFVAVRSTLESMSHPGIFAAGDCAAVRDHPREKAGVFAIRQGPVLVDNLRRVLCDRAPEPFTPQRKYLSLISTGDKHAIATRGDAFILAGDWVWRWKDWLDRRFTRKFTELPDRFEGTEPALPSGSADHEAIKELSAAAMRCGGCGGKVGATVLARVIDGLDSVVRNDVLIGLGDADDAAVVKTPRGKVMVHTVDAFRTMIDDPYLFGRIAANHSLSDIFAMGGEPQTALAIATLPYSIASKAEDTLRQMLTGAMEVLREANTALVGGHTNEGSELSLGFAVNGFIDPGRILRKGGMRPGDRLIMTKSIGTGTLFAADMRGKACGRWITAALDAMQQSNRAAAQCLHRYGANACTDVTGFGLLGHLVEMIRGSPVDVVLDLGAIPILPGALDTIDAGITSSLQSQNLHVCHVIRDPEKLAGDPRYPLLFDPQTAGGLLASIAEGEAPACVEELRALGYSQAASIGHVLPQSNSPESVTLLG